MMMIMMIYGYHVKACHDIYHIMTSYALMEKLKETFWTEIKETKEKEKKNPKTWLHTNIFKKI